MPSPTTILETSTFIAAFSLHPCTPLQVDLRLSTPLHALSKDAFVTTYRGIRLLCLILQPILNVPRWSMTTNGDSLISLKPLHGVDVHHWGAITHDSIVGGVALYRMKFPGWITTFNGPMWGGDELDAMVEPLRAVQGYEQRAEDLSPDDTPSAEDSMDPTESSPSRQLRHVPHDPSNLFAKLLKSQIPSWKFRDTPQTSAFLTPFPIVPGTLNIIPRQHWTSDILALPDRPFNELMSDVWEVLQIVKVGYGISRSAIVFEGYEIDWAHVKVYPIWDNERGCRFLDDPRLGRWREDVPLRESGDEWAGDDVKFGFQDKYEGYVSTQLGERVDKTKEDELGELARSITERVREGTLAGRT